MKKLFVISIFCLSHGLFGQTQISLDDTSGPFDLFTQVVEQRFDIKIFYKKEWVSNIENSIEIKGETIEEILTNALEGTGLGYLRYSDFNYIIAPSSEIEEVISLDYVLVKERFNTTVIEPQLQLLTIGDSSKMGMQAKSKIRLKLLDFKNDEPLAGAVLFIEALDLNSVSSPTGIVEITIPSGLYLTEIRYVGYEPFIGYLSVLSEGSIDIFLDEEIYELDEIIVSGEGAQNNIMGPSAGVVSITPRQIKELPVFLGEADLIKAILTLPGVSTLGEGTSGFFVRGGNVDQNLILQDETIFFNSSHALGFFSVFNPDLINNVTLYKGHIPAQFGGRLSSVLKVNLKGSVNEDTKVSGGIGTVMSKLALETPLSKGKSSLILGGRFTYSDYLLRITKIPELQESSASFYDFNIRYNQKVLKDGSMFLSYYQSGDHVQYEKSFGFDWSIKNLAIGWNQPINQYLFSEFAFSMGNNQNENFRPSDIESYTVQGGQTFKKIKQSIIGAWGNHEVIGGVEWIYYNPLDEILTGESGREEKRISRNGGHEFGVFFEDNWEVSNIFSIAAGLRATGFLENDTTGAENAFYKNLEPRVSFRLSTGVTTSIKASYNRINQYLHLISNTTSALPNDQWLASSESLLPKQADNFSLGFFKNFEFDQWEASTELFYSRIANLAETRSFANLILNPAIEEDIVQGDGRAYGVELYLKKSAGRLKGAFSYTYSRSQQYVALETDVDPLWLSSAFDRPHNLNLNLDYTFNKRSRFALNFVFTSGRPVTAPTSTYRLDKYVVPHYSERNEFRIPDYHRLDLAYTLKRNAIRRKKYQDSITFSIYNVYGRKNSFSVFFRKDQYSAASAYSLSILGSAFPSITYNFEF